ncbi:ABC transporter substrate-binding protein [Cohnella kolymensis]|uniref:ABC transporter substrate-binding protein n=2 Tax=Cohnella kolymensis TaxID=1590652 RepID=A0ABR5A670_9BACL|nr:ABC transporter substrate-binding protein [Cohnella kolymensis]KIL36501.1 ABC transporter substrate-binding protein [Cohnella kolymensis]
MLLILTVIVSACGGNSGGNSGESSGSNDSGGKSVKITFLNSKSEIQQQLADAAKQFTAANPGIEVEVITTSQSQSPVEKATSLYSAGTPATLAMLDAGDIAKFKDKAADLSSEKWVKDLAQPNELDGKTIAFPFAIEGYGFIYNKAVVDKAAGGKFDPATVNSTSSLEDLFKKIETSGSAPLIIGSMDWSLGNHFLALTYAAQPEGDVNKYLESLKSGEAKLADNAAFKGLMDTFDVMKKYNKGKNDPMAVTYEQSSAAVAKGEAAITFNGNWLITEMQKSNPTGEFGFIPVPVSNNASDKANTSLAIGATKQVFIDKEKSSEQQQAAAKKFLDWLVYDQAGQDFLVNKANVIPAFKNITLQPTNSLAKAIVEYNNAGKSIPFAGNDVPGDHWKVLGASMQKYLVDKSDRAALAAEVEDYWKNVK